jgi:ATP synthase subunit 6
MAMSFFTGVCIIGVQRHNIKFLSAFLPSGTSFALSLLLVPIEAMSFIFKPLSLSIRLFANIMSGHMLIKIIVGFAYMLMSGGALWFISIYFIMIFIVILFGLEMSVSFIQAFVFSTLACIYINDILSLH